MARQYVIGSYYRIVQERKQPRRTTKENNQGEQPRRTTKENNQGEQPRRTTVRQANLKQQCDDWSIPYLGPIQEECDAADALGDYQFDLERQLELDEWREDR